jgi:hypothetical protein
MGVIFEGVIKTYKKVSRRQIQLIDKKDLQNDTFSTEREA